MFKKTPTQKAVDLEKTGDRHTAKNQWHKAYACYHRAMELDNSRTHLLDKLLKTLDEMKEDWTEEHFVHSVHWQMLKQEAQDPTFRRIHARAEPEFKEIIELAKKMLSADLPGQETEFAEKIVAHGELALYPLIDLLLTFKEMSRSSPSGKNHE